MTAPSHEALPEMLNRAVRRFDAIYTRALVAGRLSPDPTLRTGGGGEVDPAIQRLIDIGRQVGEVERQRRVIERERSRPRETTPTPSATPEPTPTAAAPSSYVVQFATPDAASFDAALGAVRSAGGVRGASVTSTAIGGSSVMSVTFAGSLDELATALRGARLHRAAGRERAVDQPLTGAPVAQLALPLTLDPAPTDAIVIGNANRAALEALRAPEHWPFGTAILSGPPRSGRSLLARWFEERGGAALDDADACDETAVFHRWNAAQAERRPLLLIAGAARWSPALPDLRSRLGAALTFAIGVPDDAMLAALIERHAAGRGLALGEGAGAWLASRMRREFAEAERVVETIDRLSLERKAPPSRAIWRAALGELETRQSVGERQPSLF